MRVYHRRHRPGRQGLNWNLELTTRTIRRRDGDRTICYRERRSSSKLRRQIGDRGSLLSIRKAGSDVYIFEEARKTPSRRPAGPSR